MFQLSALLSIAAISFFINLARGQTDIYRVSDGKVVTSPFTLPNKGGIKLEGYEELKCVSSKLGVIFMTASISYAYPEGGSTGVNSSSLPAKEGEVPNSFGFTYSSDTSTTVKISFKCAVHGGNAILGRAEVTGTTSIDPVIIPTSERPSGTQLFELTSDLAVNKQLKNDDTVKLSNSGEGTIYFKCINPLYETSFSSKFEGSGSVSTVSMSPTTIKRVDYKTESKDIKIKFVCSTTDPKIDSVTVYGVNSSDRLVSSSLVAIVASVALFLTMFRS